MSQIGMFCLRVLLVWHSAKFQGRGLWFILVHVTLFWPEKVRALSLALVTNHLRWEKLNWSEVQGGMLGRKITDLSCHVVLGSIEESPQEMFPQREILFQRLEFSHKTDGNFYSIVFNQRLYIIPSICFCKISSQVKEKRYVTNNCYFQVNKFTAF